MEEHFPDKAGCADVQAPLLAHAMLHHPSAWPSQEAALGLLISLRKYYQTVWVRSCSHYAGARSHDAAGLPP